MDTTLAGNDERLTEGLKWLAGIFVVSGTALALAGATQSEMARIARYYPGLFMLSLGMLLAAVVVGARAAYFEERTQWRLYSASVGLALFFMGTMTMVYAHTESTKAQERPTAAVTVTGVGEATTAHLNLRASGLARTQYLYVLVQGHNSQYLLDPDSAEFLIPRTAVTQAVGDSQLYSVQRIQSSRIGPTPDGKVDIAFDLSIAPGLYEQLSIQATIADRGDAGRQRELDLEGETANQPVGAQQAARVSPALCSNLSEFVSCTTVLLADAPTDAP